MLKPAVLLAGLLLALPFAAAAAAPPPASFYALVPVVKFDP